VLFKQSVTIFTYMTVISWHKDGLASLAQRHKCQNICHNAIKFKKAAQNLNFVNFVQDDNKTLRCSICVNLSTVGNFFQLVTLFCDQSQTSNSLLWFTQMYTLKIKLRAKLRLKVSLDHLITVIYGTSVVASACCFFWPITKLQILLWFQS